MASEAGRFTIDDVCRAVVEKMRRRHPHVFGDVAVSGSADVVRNWEHIKARERGDTASAVDGVPRALPALQRAERIGEKAARVGFDWPDAAAVLAKVDEERAELGEALTRDDRQRVADELGDLLLATANLARKLDIEPERALSSARSTAPPPRSSPSSRGRSAASSPDRHSSCGSSATCPLERRRPTM
jgi:MazG family protein